MTISFPISLPSVKEPAHVVFTARSVVGIAISPFDLSQEVTEYDGAAWEAAIELPPMKRAYAEEWVAALLSLNGLQGSMLLGDWASTTARGTWAGQIPLVMGGSQTGKTLAVDGVAAARTALKGDWLQLGSGAASRLHKVVADATFNVSGQATLDIWPALRSSPTDNAAVVIASAKGVFRLKDNKRSWSIGRAQMYGVQFEVMEKL